MQIEVQTFKELYDFETGFLDGQISYHLGLAEPIPNINFYDMGVASGYNFSKSYNSSKTNAKYNCLESQQPDEIVLEYYKHVVLEYNRLYDESVPLFKILIKK